MNKKQLYNRIMESVAKEVKKTLNESTDEEINEGAREWLLGAAMTASSLAPAFGKDLDIRMYLSR